ncbi:2-oxoglutarate-dependent dioxygenase 21, chloroplastic-like [Andrographis paniculata]|uniref:2-oxoglutarate-dependent dioxygenase 21, chloroplastic-like n=1 Tax=Andrographis paniculata TaxID=175694 RepID=UPI0021E733E5|nr:2-oxoglutarate-dependent dioxygenase 21, chloroplastic-like [Andrographis paniculata]
MEVARSQQKFQQLTYLSRDRWLSMEFVVLAGDSVINHGVESSVIEEALDVNLRFFRMEPEAKEELMSDDVYKEVRFSTQKGDFARDFLKLYAYPLDQYIACWPQVPLDYREKMGRYTTEVRKLSMEILGAILESLNIHNPHLEQKFEKGFHILGINYYPPSLGSDSRKSGLPPHTDHSIITVLLQSAPGLEFTCDGLSWKAIPAPKGSLQVLVGDHLEVISNGIYKSVLHRAIPQSCCDARLSVASLHSEGMDEIVEPCVGLVGDYDECRKMYKGSSLRDFLKHLASQDKRAFIQTLKEF